MKLCDLKPYAGKRVCVALSGGRDSVALFHELRTRGGEYGIVLSALTCEHGIRGEQSLRDLEFVRALCRDACVPLRVFSASVPARARSSGRGLEEEGRLFRYECYAEVLSSGEADLVATAHHADDFAETVLFRLCRGTSLGGLAAIGERDGIVRPLLRVTRAEIERYVAENGLSWTEDESNADVRYTRNFLRREVIPALERAIPGAAAHLATFARGAEEDDKYLCSLAETALSEREDGVCVPVALPDPVFSRACVLAMKKLGVVRDYTRANVEEISALRRLQSGRKASLPSGAEAVREGDEIVFPYPRAQEEGEAAFCLGMIFFGGYAVEAGEGESAEGLRLDLGALPEGCVVRCRREGDVFRPFGGGEKTLKKYLSDKKIPARIGRQIPLVALGKEIYAVCGVEISDRIKLTEKTVRKGYIRTEKRR